MIKKKCLKYFFILFSVCVHVKMCCKNSFSCPLVNLAVVHEALRLYFFTSLFSFHKKQQLKMDKQVSEQQSTQLCLVQSLPANGSNYSEFVNEDVKSSLLLKCQTAQFNFLKAGMKGLESNRLSFSSLS